MRPNRPRVISLRHLQWHLRRLAVLNGAILPPRLKPLTIPVIILLFHSPRVLQTGVSNHHTWLVRHHLNRQNPHAECNKKRRRIEDLRNQFKHLFTILGRFF